MVQLQCVFEIFFYMLSFVIRNCEIIGSLSAAVFTSKFKPLHCFLKIPLNNSTTFVHHTQIILGICIALLSKWFPYP